MSESTWAFIGVGLLVLVFWFSKAPAPSIVGDKAVPTSTRFHLWGTDDNADGTYRIKDDLGRDLLAFHVRDNRVSEVPRELGDKPAYRTVFERDLYLAKSGLDLGVWSGVGNLGPDNSRWQVGARYSPVRILFGTVAPDLAVCKDAVGAGLSVYPPPDYVGHAWAHLGLGVWYMAPLDGSPPAPVFGLSFTTD